MNSVSSYSTAQKLSQSYNSPPNNNDQFSPARNIEELDSQQNNNQISPKKLSALSYPIQTFDTMKRFNSYKAQVEKKKNSELNSSRFQDLYEDAGRSQKKKEELMKKKFEEEQNYIDPECTFKPKIKKSITQSADQDKKTIFEKSQEWKLKVNEKMKSKYANNNDKDLEECTFQPNIDQNWRNRFEEPLSDFNSRGIPQYLKRQVVARKMKEYKDFLIQYPHRKHETSNKTFTVPNEPMLGVTKADDHVKSLDRPLIPDHLFDSFEQQLHPRQYRTTHSDNKHNKTESDMSQTYRKMMDNQQIVTNRASFQDALRELHEALHNIEI